MIPYSYMTNSLSASNEGVGFEQDCALKDGAIHPESVVACAMAGQLHPREGGPHELD